MRKLAVLILLVCLFATSAHAEPPLPAFPTAEGFGAFASGGRDGRVIYVTTLANDGPGSLREALSTTGKRYILFKVSGVIHTAAKIMHGEVTIAGQTSPGGITVRGILCDGHYEANNCDNLIIRHIRSRPAAYLMPEHGGYVLDDALRLDGVENVMIDHLSLANATDEAVQISMARNITIQNTIIAETIGAHHLYGGMLINYSHSQRPQDNLSIHHNLWNRITGRNPELACEMTRNIGADDSTETPSFCDAQPLNIELSSNLFWDMGFPMWYGAEIGGQGSADGVFSLNLNYAHNYAVVRPDYPYGMVTSDILAQARNQLYINGNRLSRYPNLADLDLFYCCNDFAQYAPNTERGIAQLRPIRHAFPPLSLTSAEQLVPHMIANVGAFPRDPMDRRLIGALQSGGIDPTPRDRAAVEDAFTLAFDPNRPPEAPLDSDWDGMPDAWEVEHGLNSAVQDHNGRDLSAKLLGVAGYTNLEVYLHLLAETLVANGRE